MSREAAPNVSLESVEQRIRALHFPDVDAVVAIERGGLPPAEIVASILGRPLGRLRLSYRDDRNDPMHSEPQLVGHSDVRCPQGGHILLVDDVSVTGATLRRAAEELSGFTISTMVLKGEGDYVAFPEIETCVTWPWSQRTDVDPTVLA